MIYRLPQTNIPSNSWMKIGRAEIAPYKRNGIGPISGKR
jgi:hypothetical protein